jgi:hypothetical protein
VMTPSGDTQNACGIDTRLQRWEWIALLAITLIGVTLRLFRLASWPLYGDELATIVHITDWDDHVIASPLAYLPSAAISAILGDAVWVWRVVPFLAGVSTIPAIHYVARRMGGPITAVWAAGLLSFAPWHVAQSQFARHYPLQLLLGILLIYTVWRATEHDSLANYLASGLTAFALIFLRPSSVYLLCSAIVYIATLIVWQPVRPNMFCRNRASALMIAFFTAIAVAMVLGATVYGPEIFGRSPIRVVTAAVYYLMPGAFLVACLIAVVGIWLRDRTAILYTVFTFLPILLVALTALIKPAIGVVTFPALGGLLLLISWGATRLMRDTRGINMLLASALCLALVGSSVGRLIEYYTIAHGYRAPGVAAADYIGPQLAPGDSVISQRVELIPALTKYGYNDPTFRKHFAELKIDRSVRYWMVVEDIYSLWDINDNARDWIERNTELQTMLPSYIGPRSRSLWIYLYTPEIGPITGASPQ